MAIINNGTSANELMANSVKSDVITNKAGTGAPDFPQGLNLTHSSIGVNKMYSIQSEDTQVGNGVIRDIYQGWEQGGTYLISVVRSDNVEAYVYGIFYGIGATWRFDSIATDGTLAISDQAGDIAFTNGTGGERTFRWSVTRLT